MCFVLKTPKIRNRDVTEHVAEILTSMYSTDWTGHQLMAVNENAAQLAERRRSLAGELTLSCCPALDLQPTGDHYVGKRSATGQPTRPTQPFILPG